MRLAAIGRAGDAPVSSAKSRNDQVRATRGDENGDEQPVYFEAPPKLKHSTGAGARALPKFRFLQSR
jgi:hypothetical protein